MDIKDIYDKISRIIELENMPQKGRSEEYVVEHARLMHDLGELEGKIGAVDLVKYHSYVLNQDYESLINQRVFEGSLDLINEIDETKEEYLKRLKYLRGR